MKKLIMTAAIAAMTMVSVQAQEFSNSFEDASEWWIQPAHREMVSISGDQTKDGSKALKFSAEDFGEKNMVTAMVCPFTLDAGTYTFKINIFLTDKAPTALNTNIRDKDNDRFVPVVWKFNKTEKNQWVELTQNVTLENDVDGAELNVSFSSNPKWGGTGTMYVDQIQVFKK